jgi:serine O-acetyltransferase
MIHALSFVIFNADVPPSVRIGQGTLFGYQAMGTVIHESSVIGKNCLIMQQVTIGGRSHIPCVPVLGDNILVGAGAKILGNVHIGDGSVVGANAVVVHDVPARCVVAGVPAQVIKENIDVSDYI